MGKSQNKFKFDRSGRPMLPDSVKMDWWGFGASVRRLNHKVPHMWKLLQHYHPDRLSPALIRKKLRFGGFEYQIHQRLSETHKTGEFPPREILVNEFEGDRNLVRLDRQKKRSGETPLWDTWVRVTPPAELDSRQQKAQREFDSEVRRMEKGDEYDAARRPLTEDEIRQDYIDNMRWPGARVRAQKEWEMEKIQNAIDLKHALIANHRIGSVGLKEWQVAQALESIEERRRQSAEAVERMIAARAAKREEQK